MGVDTIANLRSTDFVQSVEKALNLSKQSLWPALTNTIK